MSMARRVLEGFNIRINNIACFLRRGRGLGVGGRQRDPKQLPGWRRSPSAELPVREGRNADCMPLPKFPATPAWVASCDCLSGGLHEEAWLDCVTYKTGPGHTSQRIPDSSLVSVCCPPPGGYLDNNGSGRARFCTSSTSQSNPCLGPAYTLPPWPLSRPG